MTGLLSALSPEEVGKTLRRLRFGNREAQCGQGIVTHSKRLHHLGGEGVSRRAIYRFFRCAGDSGVEALLLGLAQDVEEQSHQGMVETAARLLEAYFCDYEKIIAPPSLLDGHALMARLGLEEGPHVGQLLAEVREAQGAGEVRTREEALSFARLVQSRSN